MNINFSGGDTGWRIIECFKTSTLRLPDPKYNNLKVGQVVIANCKNSPDHLKKSRSSSSTSQPYLSIRCHLSSLYLDGFGSAEDAAEHLDQYWTEDITPDSKMTRISFIPKFIFDNLPAIEQTHLVSTDFPLEDKISRVTFKVFLPNHLFVFKESLPESEVNIPDWHELLVTHDIFTSDYLRQIREVDEETADIFYGIGPEDIDILLTEPTIQTAKAYQSIVLLPTPST